MTCNIQLSNIFRDKILAGVEAIITGIVTVDTKESSNRDRILGVNVDCLNYNVSAQLQSRIVSIETGEIILSPESAGKGESSSCSGESSQGDALQEALREAAEALTNQFAPFFQHEKFRFESLRNKEFKEHNERAKDMLEINKLDDAYALYNQVYQSDPYNPKVMYNLGLIEELVGNYTKAAAFYQEAYQLDPDNTYRDALGRAERSLPYANLFEEYAFPETTVFEVAANRLEIKGKSSDRVEVLDAPAGAKMTQVPGGITLEILNQQGEWFEVKLRNGSGFVHQNDVKVQE